MCNTNVENRLHSELIKKQVRTTKSICPKCFKKIKAEIISDNEKVYLEKRCPIHGIFQICLSAAPALYEDLDCFYISLMKEQQPHCDYEIFVSMKCNMQCSICFFDCPLKNPGLFEPTVEAIEKFVKSDKHPFYNLGGAEATLREDLGDIIRVLKRYGKRVTINTNGVRLQEQEYIPMLRKAGLDRIIVQCDGFDSATSQIFRGSDVTNEKRKILKVLEEQKMPTVLIATIARGVNEHVVKELIDYACDRPYINGVTFITISYDGGARDWDAGAYIMPAEVIDIFCDISPKKMNKNNVYCFQKLHFALKAFFKQRVCLYNFLFVLVRSGDSFDPIDSFLNFSKAAPWLERYKNGYERKKAYAAIYLGIALFMICLNRKIFVLLKEIIFSGYSYFFRTSRYLRTSRLLALSFTTSCDPYKLDYAILKNCQNEVIGANNSKDVICSLGQEGAFVINLEKKHLMAK